MRDATTFLRQSSFEAYVQAPAARKRGVWTTRFIDVSNNNGPNLDFRQVARDSRRTGITAVEMKATEGTRFVDPYFHLWRDTCRAVGLRTFAYHFARPDEHPGIAGAALEAAHFCTVVGKVRPGEWRPMLDFETAPFDPLWARQWDATVRMRLKVAPTFYSYTAAIEGMRLDRPVGDGLVIAYPNESERVAPCPKPWRRWAAHQYSWHGHVAGIPGEVDLNWTPNVWGMLAYPARGAALEPLYAARRRRA